MKKLLLALALATAPLHAEPKAHAAYMLGYELSLVTLGRARGSAEHVLARTWQRAQVDASSLGAALPPLPKLQGKPADDTAAALRFLQSTHLDKLDRRQTALFEIGVKTSCLAVVYAPGQDQGLVQAIVSRNAEAGLPSELVHPLVQARAARMPALEFGNLLAQYQNAVEKRL